MNNAVLPISTVKNIGCLTSLIERPQWRGLNEFHLLLPAGDLESLLLVSKLWNASNPLSRKLSRKWLYAWAGEPDSMDASVGRIYYSGFWLGGDLFRLGDAVILETR